MIIEHKPQTLETNVPTTTQFSINVTAHAFDVLISKQYKNKPKSILREIISNGIDSHAEISQTRPVEVTLPTALSPELIIKDFGTGISPENIIAIYTRLFESTRNQSNTFLGGFGLGCKVPFAYVDQFSVTSRWNGTAYFYSMYRDAAGIPTCALLDTSSTTELNGITVTLGINPHDINTFLTAANEVIPWFGTQVSTNLPLAPLKTVWTGKTSSIVHNSTAENSFQARVGNVVYPIPNRIATAAIDAITSRYVPSYVNTNNYCIVLNFPIGTLPITPNREDLALADEHDGIIKNAMVDFANDLREYLHTLDIPDIRVASKTLLPIRQATSNLHLFPTLVCKQHHELTQFLTFDPPPDMQVFPLERYNRKGSRNQALRAPTWNPNGPIKIHLLHPITVIVGDPGSKCRTERILTTALSDSALNKQIHENTDNFLYIETLSTYESIKQTLEPYTTQEITITHLRNRLPRNSYTPTTRTPRPPKAALYKITESTQCIPPDNETFYVVHVDEPLTKNWNNRMPDFPTPNDHLLINQLPDLFDALRHVLPTHGLKTAAQTMYNRTYVVTPSKRDLVKKNKHAVSLRSALNRMIVNIPQSTIDEETLIEKLTTEVDSNPRINWYHLQSFIRNIPPDTENYRLKELKHLIPIDPTAMNLLKKTFNLRSDPGYIRATIDRIIAFAEHYVTFISNHLTPESDGVLHLIDLYDRDVDSRNSNIVSPITMTPTPHLNLDFLNELTYSYA